jgi:translation elongation factor P/translation initiation factor 5A
MVTTLEEQQYEYVDNDAVIYVMTTEHYSDMEIPKNIEEALDSKYAKDRFFDFFVDYYFTT